MFSISREFSFPMGHRLSKHEGRCQFIHGHNFKVVVGVKSHRLNNNDMVMDFGDLKKIVNRYIDDYCDHTLAVNRNNDKEMIEKIKESIPELRVLEFTSDPTAEILAQTLYHYVKAYIPDGIDMDFVTVYENDKSEATYETS